MRNIDLPPAPSKRGGVAYARRIATTPARSLFPSFGGVRGGVFF